MQKVENIVQKIESLVRNNIEDNIQNITNHPIRWINGQDCHVHFIIYFNYLSYFFNNKFIYKSYIKYKINSKFKKVNIQRNIINIKKCNGWFGWNYEEMNIIMSRLDRFSKNMLSVMMTSCWRKLA